MSETLTSKQAAEKLGVTPARVRQMILDGTLPAKKFGRDLVIKSSDLALVADRPLGRPPNAKPAQSNGKKRGKK